MSLLIAMLALLAGCQQAASGPSAAVSTHVATAKIAPEHIPAPAPDGGQLLEEIWDAYSMQGVRVGFAHTIVSRVSEDGRELVRTSSQVQTSMQRAGQTVQQDLTLTSWDTPAGQLVRFESRMSSGAGEIVSVGAVKDGKLGIDTTTLGRTQSQSIPWQADWGGLFAPDQTLRRAPLKPGEKRTLRSLLPVMNIPADTHLEALEYETVELPGGKAQLLKVANVIELGGQKIESIAWVNDQGQTLKTLVPSIGQESVRTTKDDALRPSTDKPYDLLIASTVPLQGDLPVTASTKRAVYRAHLKSGQIAGLFSNCLSQHVKPLDEQTAEITVLAIRPDLPPQIADNLPPQSPTAADLSPNNFIQSDDPLIRQMAARAEPAASDPWQTAVALEKLVEQSVHNKSYSQAFATAAEVIRSQEGDCTEHAVLLAALCRSRKIPARVAFGLVYYPPEKGFAYHMWNEVWIQDRWVPLDATLGHGGIGADHIKLGDSNLAGGSPLADLMAVIQVFGRLELAVLTAE